MCHPAPGPRCSAHAYAEYIHALRAYRDSVTATESLRRAQVLEEKTAAFDATPRGQSALRQLKNREQDFAKSFELQQRLDGGRALRAQQLAAYHLIADGRSTEVKKALREQGIGGRYAHAAGIAYRFFETHEVEMGVELISPDTLVLQPGEATLRALIVPLKSQRVWARATQHEGHYTIAAATSFTRVVNTSMGDLTNLNGDDQLTAETWFLDKAKQGGYALFVAVDTLTESVHVGLIDELVSFMRLGVKLQVKQGGTTPYTGSAAGVRRLLRDGVFKSGEVHELAKPRRVVVRGVPEQPRRLCGFGDVLLAWRPQQEAYEVRQRHAGASGADIIITLRREAGMLDDDLSNMAVALLGGALA